MELTKKKAIGISIKLWTWMRDTGSEYKWKWPGWENYGHMQDDCALCEYTLPSHVCDDCPISCFSSAFHGWRTAKNKDERKKHAALFLAELSELK